MAYVRATGRMRWGRREDDEDGRPEDQREAGAEGEGGDRRDAEEDGDLEAEVEQLVGGQEDGDDGEGREETAMECFLA